MAADLTFRIGAELTEIKGALASLQKDIANVGRSAQQAGGSDAFKGIEKSADGAIGALKGLVAGFVSLAAAIKLIGTADELDTLNARLRIATRSVEEYNRAQVALFDLAQRTRTSLGETVGLYSQIANATKDAGVGQETLLQVVETINQAVQLSGANAQAAQAALVQLGQGLASGTLRGEELNSVLEQTPALADAIAKGMGITRGELRKYGEEGKITAQQVITALQRQRGEVAAQFEQLPLTVGQAVTLLKNSGTQLVGAFNSATGATSGLASVIKDLADFLSSDETLGAVVEFAANFSNAFRALVDDANRAADIVRDATRDMIGSGEDLIAILGRAFRELPVNIRTSIQIVAVQAFALFDRLVSYAQFVKDNFKAIFTNDTQDAAFRRFQARNAAIAQTAQDSVDAALTERAKALEEAKKAAEDAKRRREEGRKNTGANSRGNFKPQQSDAEKKAAEQLAKAKLDAEEKLQQDSSKRQLATLEQQFKDAGVAAQDYFNQREAIELAAVEASITRERQRAAAGGTERVKALAEIELLERQKSDIVTKAARDRAEFQRNLDRQMEAARISLLTAENNPVEAARLKAESQYRDLLARLRQEGDTAGVALIERLIGSEVLDAKIRELQTKVGGALSDLRSQEGLIAAQQDAGQLPALEAERQLSVVRATAIDQLKQYRDALLAVAAAQTAGGGIADPRVIELIRQTDTEIARATASQRTLQNQIQQSATNSVTGFFTDLATGARSFGDAIKAAALQFIQSLAKMAAEALAKRAILSFGNSGGGGFFDMIAGVLKAHTGAIVGGAGGTRTMVNPLVFAGAPRYHSGGMVGLKPDERPAILQTGEEVLARNDPRNAANGGGGAGSGYRIVNVLDPGLVSNYLESSSGERTIMNVIGRNPSQVRQLIGA